MTQTFMEAWILAKKMAEIYTAGKPGEYESFIIANKDCLATPRMLDLLLNSLEMTPALPKQHPELCKAISEIISNTKIQESAPCYERVERFKTLISHEKRAG